MARRTGPRLQLVKRRRFLTIYDSEKNGFPPENLNEFIALIEAKRGLIPESCRKDAEIRLNGDLMEGGISVVIGCWAETARWETSVPEFIHIPD